MTGTPDWHSVRTVDATRAAALIGRARPELRGATVVPLGSGWDNTVVLVAGAWVVRFPRRAVALPGLLGEALAGLRRAVA